MRVENQELETTFELPDAPSYRQMMAYDSVIEMATKLPTFERLWLGVCAIAQNWQSPLPLDRDMLDKPSTPQGRAIMKWAGLAAFSWSLALKDLEKN